MTRTRWGSRRIVARRRIGSAAGEANQLPAALSGGDVTTWLKQFGVGPVTSPPESAAGSWFASPASEPMRRLATIRRLPQRVLVIFYIGQPGTFETNRPHFFNLLATLRDGPCAAYLP